MIYSKRFEVEIPILLWVPVDRSRRIVLKGLLTQPDRLSP
jgi:hypothetical protein